MYGRDARRDDADRAAGLDGVLPQPAGVRVAEHHGAFDVEVVVVGRLAAVPDVDESRRDARLWASRTS